MEVFSLLDKRSYPLLHSVMFAPKWKKEAKLLDKAAKKFLNYKRDLLDEQQIAEIESRRSDLRAAYKASDKEQCAEASKQIQATCENALPRYKAQGPFEENLEVIFVAIVVALGLRAYVVQPFRIPTGSMQPTLNGIVATSVESTDDFPSLPMRMVQKGTHGRKYVDIVLEEDKVLRKENPVIEVHYWHFFTRTDIHFTDGSKISFPGPKAALMNYRGMGFGKKVGYPTSDMNEIETRELGSLARSASPADIAYDIIGKKRRGYYSPAIPKGTVIARGYIDSGDLILVDKMSYHFRRPKRGEVFVFDTREIRGIHDQNKGSNQAAGSHYIKRLAGVPGDELELRNKSEDGSGELFINGKPASEKGIIRVMSKKDGYLGYKAVDRLAIGKTFKARRNKKRGMNEYIALGDNSFNSFDSRGWGTVKEFNVIGPAAFSLWPFGSKHWGIIK
ncbi:MAG: signal peptidase I [Akkermansiaceae bacterium]